MQRADPRAHFKGYFNVLTPVFQRPPKMGVLGRENFQLMISEAQSFETSSLFRSLRNFFSSIEAQQNS